MSEFVMTIGEDAADRVAPREDAEQLALRIGHQHGGGLGLAHAAACGLHRHIGRQANGFAMRRDLDQRAILHGFGSSVAVRCGRRPGWGWATMPWRIIAPRDVDGGAFRAPPGGGSRAMRVMHGSV